MSWELKTVPADLKIPLACCVAAAITSPAFSEGECSDRQLLAAAMAADQWRKILQQLSSELDFRLQIQTPVRAPVSEMSQGPLSCSSKERQSARLRELELENQAQLCLWPAVVK